MSTRERVMTQEQLMKVKIKYLEDRLNTLEKSIERLHKMLPRLAREFMQEDQGQGFKDIGELSQGFCLKSKDNDNEII